MQALVYSLMALSALGLGALAYFGLAFTPANAILVALVCGGIGVVVMERLLRVRAETRLERAIEELSRLLATDAQAGQVLGQRINALVDLNPGQRLETVEADISVLGTVIRQVAEAVADMEDKIAKSNLRPAMASAGSERTMVAPPSLSATPLSEREPVIPLETLRQAVSDNRLIHHIQPVVRLPQRRAVAYDLVPRLMLEDGDLADPPDFMPRRGGYDVVRQIEGAALAEAIAIARRSRTGGQPIMLNVPLSRATIGDGPATEQIMATLDANRAVGPGLSFVMAETEWFALTTHERKLVEQIMRKGAGFSVDDVTSLRIDVADMAAIGVRSLRVDAASLLAHPERFTDFHISDIASYLARFEVTLLARNVADERQIVELLDNELLQVQGDYIAPPGPVRQDLSLDAARTIAPQQRRV